jgi:N-acyl-D-amino-acid deacylase
VLAPGCVGDANVIDHDRLQLRRPELVADLPGGASRLIQRAEGYVATIKSGRPTFVGGEGTGARPGSLLRGAR